MIIREVQPSEKQEYNSLVNHLLQSYEWGEFKETTGVETIRLGWFENNVLKKAASLTLHAIPKTPYTIGYLPRGNDLSDDLIQNLKQSVKNKNCIFVKLEPDIIKNQDTQTTLEKLIKEGKIAKSPKEIFSPHNFLLDLTPTEDELLMRMHPKTRYNIKVAQKNGVTIKDQTNEEGLNLFLKLQHETSLRQGFYVHPDSYYKNLFQVFKKTNTIKILTATHNHTPLTAWILLVFKDTLYYPYGASTDKMKNVMSNNLMMWETIRLGKNLGLKKFDMWGAAPPDANRLHKWWGFTNFKEGYAPKRVEYVGTYDLIINRPLYTLYLPLEKLRWLLLGLKARFRK